MTERRSPRKLVADAWDRSARRRPPAGLVPAGPAAGRVRRAGSVRAPRRNRRQPDTELSATRPLGPDAESGPPAACGTRGSGPDLRCSVGSTPGRSIRGPGFYAVLPGLVAWTANLVFVYWVAAIGTYVLARMYGLTPLASVLGAASFAFVGSMTAQMVHLGVVQGAAWIPWMVAGELRLAQLFLPGTARRAESGPGAGGPGDHRTSHDHRTRRGANRRAGMAGRIALGASRGAERRTRVSGRRTPLDGRRSLGLCVVCSVVVDSQLQGERGRRVREGSGSSPRSR